MVICFVSGGYALYLNETGVGIGESNSPQATTPQTDVSPQANNLPAGDVSKVTSLDEINTVFENVFINNVNAYSEKVTPNHLIFVQSDFDDTDYHVFNGDYMSFYIHNDLNTSDKYVTCAECGKYVPIGEHTKKLDDNLICTGHEDSWGSNIDDDYYALTYDEVMFCVEHNGFLPESAYVRSAEHLGVTVPYEDYFARYYDSLNYDTVVTPETEDVSLPNDPVTEDVSNGDANQENELVYSTIPYDVG